MVMAEEERKRKGEVNPHYQQMETEERDRVIQGRREGAEGDEERQRASRQMNVLENHSAALDSLRKQTTETHSEVHLR